MLERLILTVLMFFGLAYIVGHSTISLPLRTLLARNRIGNFFVSLMECPSCASFHMGWLLVTFKNDYLHHYWHRSILGAVGAGCFFAGTSYLLARLTGITPSPSLPSERHIEDFFPPSSADT